MGICFSSNLGEVSSMSGNEEGNVITVYIKEKLLPVGTSFILIFILDGVMFTSNHTVFYDSVDDTQCSVLLLINYLYFGLLTRTMAFK